ncbi:MAG: hypothetical protein ACFFDN_02220 [Candidatus Hodarchaeota archaeon]
MLKKLWSKNKCFFTSDELEVYSKDLYFNYKQLIKYLVSRGYLIRIIEDIFYIKSSEEYKSNKIKLTPLELISKCLKLKKIQKWYFGLYTALTLNGITNNHDEEIYVISNRTVKNYLMKIGQYKHRFLTLNNRFLNFGIIENKIRYSDIEKTILDLIYLWKINKKNDAEIIQNISDYLRDASKDKIIDYSRHYPESNRKILENLIPNFKIKKFRIYSF